MVEVEEDSEFFVGALMIELSFLGLEDADLLELGLEDLDDELEKLEVVGRVDHIVYFFNIVEKLAVALEQ